MTVVISLVLVVGVLSFFFSLCIFQPKIENSAWCLIPAVLLATITGNLAHEVYVVDPAKTRITEPKDYRVIYTEEAAFVIVDGKGWTFSTIGEVRKLEQMKTLSLKKEFNYRGDTMSTELLIDGKSVTNGHLK